MTQAHKTPLEALHAIVATADSAEESGNTEAEVIAANWDILGPWCRQALEDWQL